MKTTILVVDDTASCRRPVERLLNAEGYETRGAANGREALELLKSFTPDLMLLDLSMPLMDGFEVLKRLREMPKLASLPVIVMTAETAPDTESRARELGAREVLLKADVSWQQISNSIRRELLS